MSIVRTVHNPQNPYVIINKAALWDKGLSLGAVGLWARLLSRPDDWHVSVSELCKSCDCGKKKIYDLLTELVDAGYAYRCQKKVDSTRSKKKKVFGSFETYVFEFKVTLDEIKKMFPQITFALTDFPVTGNGHTTNITSSKEEVCLAEEPKKENKEGGKAPVTPPSAAAESLCDLFLSKIKERSPEFKEPDREKWVREFDCLLRIDKRNLEKTKKLIHWASEHKWWKKACLSPSKLRKDYDLMSIDAQGDEEQQLIRFNRSEALKLKEEYPDKLKAMTFNDKYVMNRSTAKEIPFNLPKETFMEGLISMFGGYYVKD